MPSSIPVHLLWQSAMPVKQAIVMRKMGAEKAESEDAKAFLGRSEEYYILRVVGLPANVEGQLNEQTIAGIIADTTLTTDVKGRTIKPTSIKNAGPTETAVTLPANAKPDQGNANAKGKGKGFGRGGAGGGFDIYFLFPRSEVFDIDKDKELKFESKINDRIKLKKSFKLKDMVYNGKLEL